METIALVLRWLYHTSICISPQACTNVMLIGSLSGRGIAVHESRHTSHCFLLKDYRLLTGRPRQWCQMCLAEICHGISKLLYVCHTSKSSPFLKYIIWLQNYTINLANNNTSLGMAHRSRVGNATCHAASVRKISCFRKLVCKWRATWHATCDVPPWCENGLSHSKCTSEITSHCTFRW